MRLMALGGVGVICGAGYVATTGPDIEREVSRPPAAVYAAFASQMQQEGPVTIDGNNPAQPKSVTIETDVDKVPDKSLDFRVLVNKRPAMTISMRFEPLDGGRGTKLLADASMDRQLLEAEAGVWSDAPQGIEQVAFPMIVGQVIDKRLDLLSRGIAPPYHTLFGALSSQRRHAGYDSYHDSVYARAARQRAASAPMMSARPMVNPTAIARQHMRGE
jgi:hypothetical protein